MNRKVIAGLVAGTLLAVSVTVWAAPTASQKQKLEAAQAKMVEAQKEMVNAQANAGLISKEQAQRIIEQLDAQAARSKPLTEAQQKELADAYAKQVAAKKELVSAQVEAGFLSKEQGDAMLKRIEAEAAYQEKMGFADFRGELGMDRVRIGAANGVIMKNRGGMMRGKLRGHGAMMGGAMRSRPHMMGGMVDHGAMMGDITQ